MNDPRALAFQPKTHVVLLREFREACSNAISELATAMSKDADQRNHIDEAWEHIQKAGELVNRIDPEEKK